MGCVAVGVDFWCCLFVLFLTAQPCFAVLYVLGHLHGHDSGAIVVIQVAGLVRLKL
jgi:hypothetical protein